MAEFDQKTPSSVRIYDYFVSQDRVPVPQERDSPMVVDIARVG